LPIESRRYRGIVAQVPFVDVVTTMLDDSIPLTTNEYDEWGNPNEREDYDTACRIPLRQCPGSRLPCDVRHHRLWDSQVQYTNRQMIAKLRASKTDQNPIFLHVDMEPVTAASPVVFNAIARSRWNSLRVGSAGIQG